MQLYDSYFYDPELDKEVPQTKKTCSHCKGQGFKWITPVKKPQPMTSVQRFEFPFHPLKYDLNVYYILMARLAGYREHYGITDKDLAPTMGISIGRMGQMRRRPHTNGLIRYAYALAAEIAVRRCGNRIGPGDV